MRSKRSPNLRLVVVVVGGVNVRVTKLEGQRGCVLGHTAVQLVERLQCVRPLPVRSVLALPGLPQVDEGAVQRLQRRVHAVPSAVRGKGLLDSLDF